MSDPDVHGPIDFLVLEFPPTTDAPDTAKALLDLVNRGTVHVYDFMVVAKDDAASCSEVDVAASDGPLASLGAFAGARSGLLDADDVAGVADVLDAGSVAAVVRYENTWDAPFVTAARAEGASSWPAPDSRPSRSWTRSTPSTRPAERRHRCLDFFGVSPAPPSSPAPPRASRWVQRRQAERFAQRDAQIYADRTQGYQQATAPAPAAAPPPPAPDRSDTLAQLQQLGELKAQGILTEEEFAAEKARILGG